MLTFPFGCLLVFQIIVTNYIIHQSWPINGGYLKEDESVQRLDLLISGHEDGSVRFWNAGTSALSLLYTFKTNQFFSTEDEAFEDVGNHTEEEEEEWPPFRKVCSMHTYRILPHRENIIASLKDRLTFKIERN